MSKERSREELSRANDSRKATLNPDMYRMVYTDPLWVDQTNRPEDVTYHWMAFSVLNEPHRTREAEAMRLGFTPVPAARHPERQSKYFVNQNQFHADFIEHSGLILCEINTELYRQIQERNMREIRQVTNGLHGLNDMMMDPSTAPGGGINYAPYGTQNPYNNSAFVNRNPMGIGSPGW